MKQPEAWAQHVQTIVATGRRPHFAPSEEILDLQRERVSAFVASYGDGCLALILGATPELADMALMAGCRVVRIDCNPSMFEIARGRQRVTDRHNETIVIGDWLHLDSIRDGEADLVLGDSSLNNVSHADMPKLLAELARVTRAGSLLCLRQIVLPDRPVPDYRFSTAVEAFRAGRIADDHFHRMLRFYSFTEAAYDPRTFVLDARLVFAEIRHKYLAGELSQAESDFLFSRYSEIRHTVYPCSEQLRLLNGLGICETAAPRLGDGRCKLFNIFAVSVR